MRDQRAGSPSLFGDAVHGIRDEHCFGSRCHVTVQRFTVVCLSGVLCHCRPVESRMVVDLTVMFVSRVALTRCCGFCSQPMGLVMSKRETPMF